VEQIEEKMVEMNQLAFPHKAVKSKSTIVSPPNCDFTICSEIVPSLAYVPHVLLLSSKICNILMYESLYCSRENNLLYPTFDTVEDDLIGFCLGFSLKLRVFQCQRIDFPLF
jgi:hypothetical protein